MDRIIRGQEAFLEEMLFRYHTVSSTREHEVFGMFPAYLESEAVRELIESAKVIDGVVCRVVARQLAAPENKLYHVPEFPLFDEIMGLERPLRGYHWCRYDGFLRADGGVFFSEFNYDKPCAQREVLFNEQAGRQDDNETGNGGLREAFVRSIRRSWEGDDAVVAVMVDPGHQEEAHLALLYKRLLEGAVKKVLVVSPMNLTVEGDRVLAFGEKIDVILRQFPAEHLHEGPVARELLSMHDRGRVTILNDPRWILGQAKSLFGHLWELAEDECSDLTEEERKVIKRAIPRTERFHPAMVPGLRQKKDSTVIKPIYGRYSIDVFIGAMMDDEEWEETLQYVLGDEKEYIVQEFCPIRQDVSLRFNGSGYEEVPSFGNIGIYLTDGEYSGSCVRWSTDYLSEDEVVWTTPLFLKETGPLVVKEPDQLLDGSVKDAETYERLWASINEEAAFRWGYTGGYTGHQHSFSIQAAVMDRRLEEELRYATERMTRLIDKTNGFVLENRDLLFPILGIPKGLEELVSSTYTDALCFLGRMDWVITPEGQLRFLEFNAETPAGVIETLRLSPLIRKECHPGLKDPNLEMEEAIRESFRKIVGDYSREKEIRVIGLTASSYYEDWYNLICMAEILRELPYELVVGEFAALAGGPEGLTLCGKPIDALYRFYPLDWFDGDERLKRIAEGMRDSCHSINPPGTLIPQSKAFLAILWELMAFDFYDEEEKAFIERYVPYTSLKETDALGLDFVRKPLFEREGLGIELSIAGGDVAFSEIDSERMVFQQRQEIGAYPITRCNTMGSEKKTAYPVVGTYVADRRYCGVFLRAGARITDNWALYLPTYVKDEKKECEHE